MRFKAFTLGFTLGLFDAMSDETRLRILWLLSQNPELSISDIELILEFTQAKVSRHITILKQAGLVTSRRANQFVLYRIKDELKEVINSQLHLVQKEGILAHDQKIAQTLLSNRELSVNKLKALGYRG